MAESLITCQLALGGVQIAKELELRHEPLIFTDVYNYRGAMTSLGKNESALRLLNALNESSGVSPKLGDRLDVLLEIRALHEGSLTYFQGYR